MFNVIRTDVQNKDFVSLVSQLDIELSIRYATDQEKFNLLNKMDGSAKVVVAFKDNTAVGCGCFRPGEDSKEAEIKRMYVLPKSRGLGVANLILTELECWAKEEGYSIVKLETGIKQPEAIALYSKLGYTQIENYGPYKHIPVSVCMTKNLE